MSRERIGIEVLKICKTAYFVPGFMFFYTLGLTQDMFTVPFGKSYRAPDIDVRWTEERHALGMARLELLEKLLSEPERLEVLPRMI